MECKYMYINYILTWKLYNYMTMWFVCLSSVTQLTWPFIVNWRYTTMHACLIKASSWAGTFLKCIELKVYAAETSHSQYLELILLLTYIICSSPISSVNYYTLLCYQKTIYLSQLCKGPYTKYNMLTSSSSTLGSSSHISQILVS